MTTGKPNHSKIEFASFFFLLFTLSLRFCFSLILFESVLPCIPFYIHPSVPPSVHPSVQLTGHPCTQTKHIFTTQPFSTTPTLFRFHLVLFVLAFIPDYRYPNFFWCSFALTQSLWVILASLFTLGSYNIGLCNKYKTSSNSSFDCTR